MAVESLLALRIDHNPKLEVVAVATARKLHNHKMKPEKGTHHKHNQDHYTHNLVHKEEVRHIRNYIHLAEVSSNTLVHLVYIRNLVPHSRKKECHNHIELIPRRY